MRTYVRARRDDPPRRPRLVLCVGRAAGRSSPARPAGHRRRGSRARRQLRGEGVRRPDRDGRPSRPPPVPARGRRPAAHVGVQRGEQGRVPRLRRHDAAGRRAFDRRGVPRRARDEADRRHARDEIAARLRRDVRSSAWACPSPSASPERSSSRRSRAASRSPTGCSSFRRTGNSHSCMRCRSSGSGASAQVTARKLHQLGITTVGEVAASRRGALVSIVGLAVGRQLHALAHNRDPRRVQAETPGGARSARNARSAVAGASPAEVDAVLLGLVDRVTRRMRAAGRVGRTVTLRLRFDDFSRATRSCTLDEATAETQTIMDTARGLLAAATPTIERRGLTLVGVGRDESGERLAATARTPVRPPLHDCSRPGGRPDPRALRVERDHARSPARPRHGVVDAAPARLMTPLAEIVAASQGVAATSARSRKVAILAELLGRLEPGEVAAATGFLSGIPRQGRVGVGYSAIYGIDVPPRRRPRSPSGISTLRSQRFRARPGAGPPHDAAPNSRISSRMRLPTRPTSPTALHRGAASGRAGGADG